MASQSWSEPGLTRDRNSRFFATAFFNNRAYSSKWCLSLVPTFVAQLNRGRTSAVDVSGFATVVALWRR